MSDPASPTVRRRRLAGELRRLREGARLTGDQVAHRMDWSASKVSRIENARTAPRALEVRRLLVLYGVEGRYADELVALAAEAAEKGWWESFSSALPPEYAAFIGMEAEAQSALSWEPLIIPGLLQTGEYAREVTKGYLEWIDPVPPSETSQRVAARLARQEVLTRDKPLWFSAVLDQSVLDRQFGGRNVMYSQIARLIELFDRPNISLRILPLKGGHPIGTGAFVLLQFGDVHTVAQEDVVYIENLTGGRYAEEKDEVFRYRRAFDRLYDLTLDEGESRKALLAARDAWK